MDHLGLAARRLAGRGRGDVHSEAAAEMFTLSSDDEHDDDPLGYGSQRLGYGSRRY